MVTEPINKKIEQQVTSDQYTILLLQDISKKLGKLLGIQGKILAEGIDGADSGEYLVIEDTATTTINTVYMKDLIGHYVKGYTLQNDGANEIHVGHNIELSKRFSSVNATESLTFSYNRRKIKNIYIQSISADSDYRLLLQW